MSNAKKLAAIIIDAATFQALSLMDARTSQLLPYSGRLGLSMFLLPGAIGRLGEHCGSLGKATQLCGHLGVSFLDFDSACAIETAALLDKEPGLSIEVAVTGALARLLKLPVWSIDQLDLPKDVDFRQLKAAPGR